MYSTQGTIQTKFNVKTAYVYDDNTTQITTDSVEMEDVKSGAMSINGHSFKSSMFGNGLNISVKDADTNDPAFYINGELVMEGCGMKLILESVMEILRLECAVQDEYPS